MQWMRKLIVSAATSCLGMGLIVSCAPVALFEAPGPEPTTRQSAPAKEPGVETVVFLRHGEKPPTGEGNLTPQGLNRALALSEVLPAKFGKPDYLFAPDPAEKVNDAAGPCYYVRPLITLEPTAIRLGMPMQTPFGFRDVDKLVDEISKPRYDGATIFVAWEHVYAAKGAADLLEKFGGDPKQAPHWSGKDYDSLYVVKVKRVAGEAPTASFTLEHEHLDNESKSMPVAAKE